MTTPTQLALLLAEDSRDSDPGALRTFALEEKPNYALTGRRHGFRMTTRRPRTPRVTFEPVVVHNRSFALMLVTDVRVLHNGAPCRPVTLLSVRDELAIEGHRLFVSSFRPTAVRAPSPTDLDRTCPICRIRIQSETQLFDCANCRAALHCEDGGWPEDTRLECAKLASECPNCFHPITFEEGLQWTPEL